MNKKLDKIRAKAIDAREKLLYANSDHHKDIARLVRGAVLVDQT